jgi:LmbE family N-acetylglucosaminyl deacetylase
MAEVRRVIGRNAANIHLDHFAGLELSVLLRGRVKKSHTSIVPGGAPYRRNKFLHGATMHGMDSPQFTELKPSVVLGIAAHPDDLDFGASGTLAKFAQNGAAVHYLILTDGGKGSEDRHITSAELTKLRKQEQQAAVTAIGGAGVEFLDEPDGALLVTLELKKAIVKAIRTLKPDVVITMDPSVLYSAARGFINHPDHRAAGQAVLDAVFPLARDHLSFPELYAEGYEPHKVATILLTNFEQQNFMVDITDTIDLKLAAIAAHASQFADLNAVSDMIRQMASKLSAKAGGKYAEGFVRIDIH